MSDVPGDSDKAHEGLNDYDDSEEDAPIDAVKVWILFGKTALPYENIPKETTLGDFKKLAEETFFEMEESTVPGPSARCIYRDARNVEASDDSVIGDYIDATGQVEFTVSPPKRSRSFSDTERKKRRIAIAINPGPTSTSTSTPTATSSTPTSTSTSTPTATSSTPTSTTDQH